MINSNVKHPITGDGVLITEHLPIFSYFFSQIEQFFVIGCINWRVTNVFRVLEIKEQHKKHRKKRE
jgi:hypothetical protein